MMSQALYRKYRPHKWDEVIGQEHIVTTLRNAIASGRVGHAYLFAGPRGTGKTTTARLLAKSVNCQAPDPADRPCDQCPSCLAVNEGNYMDLIEIDAASNTSVEDVRDLRDKINFAPSQGSYRVYIIDEVHMLSTAAFNALLKTLEEPPPHAIFILATTEIHKVPATVLSRCQRHEFRRASVANIVTHLRTLVEKEALQVAPDVLTLIARQATGSYRDAISLLDQLASSEQAVSLETAQNLLGTAIPEAVASLVDAILERDSAAGLDQIHKTLDGGADPRQFARQVVDYLRSILLILMQNAGQVDATDEMLARMKQHAGRFDLPVLLEAIRLFNSAATDARQGWQPGLPLELAFASAIMPQTAMGVPVEEQSSPTRLNPAQPPYSPQPQATAGNRPPETRPTSGSPNPLAPRADPGSETARGTAAVQAAASLAAPGPARDASAAPAKPPVDHPPSTATPQEAAAPGQAARGVTLQAISAQWRQVLALLHEQKHLQTEAFLRTARLMGLREGALVIGLNSEFSKKKMESGEHPEITRRAIVQVLGVDIPVSFTLASGKPTEKPTPDVDVDSDGIVGTALRDLGGEIVDVK